MKVLPPSPRNPSRSRSWIVGYRPGDGGRKVAKKRVVLGSPETLTPEQARAAARRILAEFGWAKTLSPCAEARTSKTIAELELLYSEATNPLRKPRTVELYRGLWSNHLLPSVGGTVARNLAPGDVVRMHRTIGQVHRSTANRLTILLAHFFEWAQASGYVPKGHNPARGVKKFSEAGRERYLSTEELSRLGAAIRAAETLGVPWKPADLGKPNSKHVPKRAESRRTFIDSRVAAALRLLVFTGARLREISPPGMGGRGSPTRFAFAARTVRPEKRRSCSARQLSSF